MSPTTTTSHPLVRDCLLVRILGHRGPGDKYDDPWWEFSARYDPYIRGWLRRRQALACPVVRNIEPDHLLSVVYEGFRTLRPERLRRPGSFRLWLQRVMQRAMIDLLRRESARTAAEGRADLPPAWGAAVAELAQDFHDDQLAECFRRVIADYCRGLAAPWQLKVVEYWAAKVRRTGDLDSQELVDGKLPKSYRAIAEQHCIPPTRVYAFIETFKPEIHHLVESALARLDRLDPPT